jgi:hypothetical protein
MPRLRIAYGDMDGLWVVEPPASPVKVVAMEYADVMMFSDDNSRILYYSNESTNVHLDYIGLISANAGGNYSLLPRVYLDALEQDSEDAVVLDAQWIPGTHRLLFSTMTFVVQQTGWTADDNLFIINADSASVSRLYKAGAGGIAAPSPDGKIMAVSQCNNIFLASIYGQILFTDIVPINEEARFNCTYPQIIWARDASRFGTIIPSESGGAAIWSVDASTGAASTLGTIAQFDRGSLSPTLEYVGYTHGKDSRSYDVTISKVDGTGSIRLFTGESYFFSFSPDGLHFAYWVGCLDPNSCPDESSINGTYIGSLEGDSFRISGAGVQWINNSQFVWKPSMNTLFLGDVAGNSIEIASGKEGLQPFDARDLDFRQD